MKVQIDSDVLQALIEAADLGAGYLADQIEECEQDDLLIEQAEDYAKRADAAYDAIEHARALLS